MKDDPHEGPVTHAPEIKVKRQRRRIYQEASDQPESPAAVAGVALEPEVLPPEESTASKKHSEERSLHTKRQHVPAAVRAERILENSMAASMGLGILPLPLLDTAGIMGIQLYMIRELSKTYEVEFSLIRSQAFVTSLIGGVGSVSIATGLFGSLVKMIPVFGGVAGALTLPVIAGAATYALGRLCIQSFSQGQKTPVSISQSTRQRFNAYFKKGIAAANDLRNKESKTRG